MNRPPCESLDDYLAHDLAGDELARFDAHLAACADCSRAVEESRRLAGLLSEAIAESAPVPAGLTDRVRGRLWADRRRRLARLAVAAGLVVAFAGVVLLNRPAPPTEEPDPPVAEVRPEPPAPEDPAPAPFVRVAFPGSNVFAVAAPSDSPNVTFIWVYPGLRAPRPTPAEDDPNSSPERSDS